MSNVDAAVRVVEPGVRPAIFSRVAAFIATALAMMGTYYVYDAVGPVAELLSRQLHLSDSQIGSLNAVYSLPNIFMGLLGGILIDRWGARRVMLSTTALGLLGAALTACSGNFHIMLTGRLLFGLGAETTMVAVLVALGQWFGGRSLGLALALNLSLARLGSYLADRSPSFASALYAQGWQAPLWLAAAMSAMAFVGALLYAGFERHESRQGTLAAAAQSERLSLRGLLRLPREYWYILGICVAFYSVIFPFRSTFAIKYFQQARGLSLEDASRINSYVFMSAILAMPLCGYIADRFGRHAILLMVGSLLLPLSFLCLLFNNMSLSVPTALLGISFSLVPAVLWPAVTNYVSAGHRGTAYGLMALLQNVGLTVVNVAVGVLNDRNAASATHPEGYIPMLWFLGVLSLFGFAFSALLTRASSPVQAVKS